ncbi:hypothetical protein GCM10009799_18860 [Nocardiopsis rhodophaea]|uniref:DUF5668 domain-containing protein n=1 Tax=Nocardiopsis rhodophaea TaxID=280238 RepID=A0ABN2SX74_9ACTN
MRRRKTDWGSLIAGLLFVGLGVAFVVGHQTDWGFDPIWVLPILTIGLGVAGLARALSRPGEPGEARDDRADT